MTENNEDLNIVEEQVEDVTETEATAEQTDAATDAKKAGNELEELQQQVEEKDDKILRLSAEIQNMQRRSTKERQDAAKYRSQALAEKMVDSLDNLDRALQLEVSDDKASQNFKKGIEMVHKSLLTALADEGVTIIDPKGDIFDPNFHQSVSSIPVQDGQQAEEVVEVYQKGYAIKDRVIRPAMVVIAQ